jgi:Arc/MetJ-type ribon-helix-helix transcriptional regulator
MPTSLRLDRETEQLVVRLAYEEGRTKSDVIREAIRKYGQKRKETGGGSSLFEAIRPFLGVERGRGPALSADTGKRFTDIVREKARKRWGWAPSGEKRRRRR